MRYYLLVKGTEREATESAKEHGVEISIVRSEGRSLVVASAEIESPNLLIEWFLEGLEETELPYPPGTLLFYRPEQGALSQEKRS